ncbi:fatty acid desaturase [Simiduia sp. 21SJ11W-1]|uniref:fatty acid desaturase n=1 Tax=Simiduia sp. 21SJ11W-1 TaxID=2909669 RepID=UPI0020A1C595|nr:fatty acid desaturase [Simiduia sp. 21SJ11W-1]UTA47093.1 fatty acid desaturase [Simiduia sp. 21SJ11W-1]
MSTEQAFKAMLKRPEIAWPTLALLLGCWLAFGLSVWAAITGGLHWGAAVLINAIAAYAVFTVGHDAAHGAVSRHRWLNDGAGFLSTLLLSPVPFFRMFRFMHMQHHRHVNEPVVDPDHYCGTGPWYSLPLRWATLDLYYMYRYLQPGCFGARSRADQRAFLLALGWALLVLLFFVSTPYTYEYLVLFILPTRIAVFFLAFCFDFLPHHPHQVRAKDNPHKATANLLYADWLLCPLLTMQNYHLSHHLYPSVPFYRYRAAWRARPASEFPAAVDRPFEVTET